MFCHNNTHVGTILVAATANESEKVKVPADLYALKMSEVKNKDRKQYTHIQVEVQEEGERRRRVMGQVVQDSLQVHLQLLLPLLDERFCLVAEELLGWQQALVQLVAQNQLSQKKQQLVIIIREICKVPTLQLKALNKHNTHYAHQDGKCHQELKTNT